MSHLEWLIENQPQHEIHSFLLFSKNCKQFRDARRIWLKQVALYPEDTQVLHNAAEFCSLWSPTYSEKYWCHLQSLEPQNAKWPYHLCEFYLRHAKVERTRNRKRLVAKAMEAALLVLDLHANDSGNRCLDSFYRLTLPDLIALARHFQISERADELQMKVRNRGEHPLASSH